MRAAAQRAAGISPPLRLFAPRNQIVRATLGQLLFSGDDQKKSLKVISGGAVVDFKGSYEDYLESDKQALAVA